MKEHPDLIFLDATVRLFEVQTSIDEYIGNDLIAMIHRTDDRICNKGKKLFNFNYLTLFFILIINLI